MSMSNRSEQTIILPEDVREELEQFIRLMEREWKEKLVSVVVFGSYARGQARPESDLDLLLVRTDLPKSRLTRRHLLYQLERRIGHHFTDTVCSIILTPEEAQTVKPYYLGMLSGHMILFDRDNFFAGVLERLRKRLKELGSERRYDPDGYEYWILKKNAKLGEAITL
jgi:hypothetical protein